jgi:hypothetical protein
VTGFGRPGPPTTTLHALTVAFVATTVLSAPATSATAALSAPATSATAVWCRPWNRVAAPALAGEDARLQAVTVASPDDVWAVGLRGPVATPQPLAERWDGAAWSVVPTPTVADAGVLTGASLAGADVVAVGWQADAGGNVRTLAERWDGSAWTAMATPAVGETSGFAAVAGTEAGDAWAVGSSTDQAGGRHTLVERWDGSTWTVVPSPSPGTDAELAGVTIDPARGAWAVGSARVAAGRRRTLIERWDGSAWTAVPSPSPGHLDAILLAVDATAPDRAWAVGSYQRGSDGHPQTLTLRWDGIAWRQAPSGDRGDLDNVLRAVDTGSDRPAWAVGDNIDVDETGREPLVMRWNGTTWYSVAAEDVGGLGQRTNELYGVAGVSATDAWAVGRLLRVDGHDGALIERFTPCGPSRSGPAWAPPSSAAGAAAQRTVRFGPSPLTSSSRTSVSVHGDRSSAASSTEVHSRSGRSPGSPASNSPVHCGPVRNSLLALTGLSRVEFSRSNPGRSSA